MASFHHVKGGYVFQAHGSWYVRYDLPRATGAKRQQKCKFLGRVADLSGKEARRRAEHLMEALANNRWASPATVGQFVAEVYWPEIELRCRPSTVKGYRNIWHRHLEPILAGRPLLGFQHRDAQQVVAAIARGFSRRTVQRAKNLLSGIFTVARRLGYYAEANPVSGVALPRRLPSAAETVAYNLEEVLSMLRILPLDLAAPVAVAAFAGLRQGEIRGLRRSDYDGRSLLVACSLWYKHESLPKNNSVEVVPVIRPLAEVLDRYLEAYPGSPADRMFRGQHGQPLRLDTVAVRRLRPLFQAHGMIPWRGWHAFRRGLATTLRRLGVPIEVVARILRDKSVTVVRQHYVRMVEADSAAAMRQLEQSVQQLCNGENVKLWRGRLRPRRPP